MLIQQKNQDGTLTSEGKALEAAGLGFLPESFNVDDGLVGKAETEAIAAHPSLDNVAWHEYGVIAAAQQYAHDHFVQPGGAFGHTAPEEGDLGRGSATAIKAVDSVVAKHMARLYPQADEPIVVEELPIPESLPSAEDLDTVAKEEEIKQATAPARSNSQKRKQ